MPRKNPNNVTPEGQQVSGRAIPGRPKDIGTKEPVSAKQKEAILSEVLFLNGKGVLCKNVYETVRSANGKYRRLLRTEKNIKA